jgi:hypothetical protein
MYIHIDNEPDRVALIKTVLERTKDRFAVEAAIDAGERRQFTTTVRPIALSRTPTRPVRRESNFRGLFGRSPPTVRLSSLSAGHSHLV